MSQTRFTPGPWVTGGCSGRMIQPLPKKGLDYWIADVDIKANAHLIAAAPELYEALQHVMTAHGEQLDYAFAQAQDALAKARGEDQ